MAKTVETVVLKLYREGMVVYINKPISFTEIKKVVTTKFKKSENFFKGLTLRVGFKGAALDMEQLLELVDAISEVLDCKAVLWENPQPFEETTEEKVKKSLSAEQILSKAFKIELEDEKTKFYTKTVRSGQLLESEGNIVVVGDVNPGAELVAEGNIIVMGTVKGRVHAGAKGNRSAIVCALNLSPIQLRIADLITRSPDEDENHVIVPQIAYIKDDIIFIEEFLQKRK
ncbi:MAG: septum site-determining protein MinC [Clostridia bacterium]|nr:septum site-determining protein MinC [Oscillospiraceae bacterium]MBQ7959981.1 septum site-determining protein MinC [Clostridia bacterium]